MPELVEVEAFRWGLLPLVVEDAKKKGFRLQIERIKDNPPKNFITDDQIKSLNNNCVVTEVERKGKLLCMTLDCIKPITLEEKEHERIYMFCHMSMTGRISTPDHVPALESQPSTDYPPPYTYLTWKVVDPKKKKGDVVAEASFSDPRKFGSIELATDRSQFDDMAPDGLEIEKAEEIREKVVTALAEKNASIKALLLDQKRATSGVGNWIADEIMYQCEMHPEQKMLTREEAERVVDKLSHVLKTGLDHLKRKEDFPKDWMFGYRWTKKAKDSKDCQGRPIEFVKVGGRTSAIVAAIQKLEPRGKETKKKKAATPAKAGSKGDEDGKEKKKSSPKKKQPAKRKAEADRDAKEEEKSPAKKKKTKQQSESKEEVKKEEVKEEEKSEEEVKEEEKSKEEVKKESKTSSPEKKNKDEPTSKEDDDGFDSEDDLPIVKLKQKMAAKAKKTKKKA